MKTDDGAGSNAKKSTGVRLSDKMRERLIGLATERRWTMSAYIEWALEQHLESIDTKKQSPSRAKRP